MYRLINISLFHLSYEITIINIFPKCRVDSIIHISFDTVWYYLGNAEMIEKGCITGCHMVSQCLEKAGNRQSCINVKVTLTVVQRYFICILVDVYRFFYVIHGYKTLLNRLILICNLSLACRTHALWLPI